MANQQPQLELVRAWENYFRQRGGASPNIPQEVLPVVLLDDNAPYPAFRAWVGSRTSAALAGNFSYVGVQNADPAGTRSVVVVEEIIWRPSVAADVTVCLTLPATAPLGTLGAADDVTEDK